MQGLQEAKIRKVTELSNRRLRLLLVFAKEGKLILREDPSRGPDPFADIGLQEGHHYRKEWVLIEGFVKDYERARLFTLLTPLEVQVQARRGFNRTRVTIEG